MTTNVVENNNSFTDFRQIWSPFIYTEDIPEDPPTSDSTQFISLGKKYVKTATHTFSYEIFVSSSLRDNKILLHLSNFKLTREFRQKEDWKLEFNGIDINGETTFNFGEEAVRRIIFPGRTTSRGYFPTFTTEGKEIPYTYINPTFNLKDCRITTSVHFDELYFTGWLYVGKSLKEVLNEVALPFDDNQYLLQNKTTGNAIKIKVTDPKIYVLPPDNIQDLYEEVGDLIVTRNSLNYIINQIGELDCGEYW